MSYEPTTWRTGDVVTSAKLNKLERGVAEAGGGGVTIVHAVNDTLDMTAGAIMTAAQTGPVVLIETGETPGAGCASVSVTEGVYIINGPTNTYTAESASGYPSSGGK